jgi:hypothetical protein
MHKGHNRVLLLEIESKHNNNSPPAEAKKKLPGHDAPALYLLAMTPQGARGMDYSEVNVIEQSSCNHRI